MTERNEGIIQKTLNEYKFEDMPLMLREVNEIEYRLIAEIKKLDEFGYSYGTQLTKRALIGDSE